AHPGDADLYEKAQRALRHAGRVGDVMQLHERYAAAVGGPRGAKALLAAAEVAERELDNAQRAYELRLAAVEVSPDSIDAVQLSLAEQRRRNDLPGVATQLRRLIELTNEPGAANGLRLELAEVAEALGDDVGASDALNAIRRAGPSAFGYAQSLVGLERVARRAGNEAAVADVQLAAAELLAPVERAPRLLDAARSLQRAGDVVRAESVTREAVMARSTREGLALLVELARAQQQPEKTARALVDLAEASEGAMKARLMLEAVDAWQAAGSTEAAVSQLERVLRAVPNALTSEEAGARFTALGAPAQAAAVAFEPALASGDVDRALQLAEAANDAARVTKALEAAAAQNPDGAAAVRLAERFGEPLNVEGLIRLARASTGALGQSLWRELLFTHHHPDALDAVLEREGLEATVSEAVAQRDVAALVALFRHAVALPPDQREAFLVAVAELVPQRRLAIWRELATLRHAAGRYLEATETLLLLAKAEEDPKARAALQVERGEIFLHDLHDASAARSAFERALVDDAHQVAAVRELVSLYHHVAPEPFVSMVQRLTALTGPEGTAEWQPAVADALQTLGRDREAYDALGRLEENDDRLARRAELATRLGLGGEALVLREKLAVTPEAREKVLWGYLEAELVPFAVRLATELRETLTPATKRFLAEKLSGTEQGAPLAIGVWLEMLPSSLSDADAWTLLAEALRRAGRSEEGALADGFGAALSTGSRDSLIPFVAPSPLAVEPERFTSAPVSPDWVAVDESSMPRLFAAVGPMLEALGRPLVQVSVDPLGGVEVWLASDSRLVLGAGALAVFGPPELSYAVAVALALGPGGVALTTSGPVPGLVAAAEKAFDAVPSSLAAARVLTHYAESLRGGDPHRLEPSQVLPKDEAFRAVAARALTRLAGP
ncbi:MAG: hypothetical protein JNG84_05660, partial [Archangium sp.]|nr:hypothetical protein [Archangium sp.]